MRVVGIAHSFGKYEGNEYDNMKIHCIRSSDPNREETGEITEIIKVKTDFFNTFNLICKSNGVDFGPGCEIDPVYNRYGQVVDIEIK